MLPANKRRYKHRVSDIHRAEVGVVNEIDELEEDRMQGGVTIEVDDDGA